MAKREIQFFEWPKGKCKVFLMTKGNFPKNHPIAESIITLILPVLTVETK
jgi:hypothetical protein